jgi:NAD(P)-dependent dehydrogenase (short-subunit alcohol dehydrogenase family)
MMSPIPLPDLTGWVALITRGYQGLGLRMAVAVGERGANVASDDCIITVS